MKKEIRKQLRSDYEELEIKPSEDLWAKLDQKLSETSETAFKPSFQWWKYAAAVILLLISAGTFIYYNQNQSRFDHQAAESIVKETVQQMVNPDHPDKENPPVIVPEKIIREHEEVKVVKNEKNILDEVKAPFKKTPTSEIHIVEDKEQPIALVQPEKPEVKAETPPVMAQAKVEKISYINANDLLLGNEYDKNRAKADKNHKKFGVFNFDRVGPNIGNVTVLGVTVYIDSK